MAHKLTDAVKKRITHAPFIEIQDCYYHDLMIDHRTITSVRAPSYDTEKRKGAGACLYIVGLPHPLIVADEAEFIVDLIKAAGGGRSFITLDLRDEDDGQMHIDATRIFGFKAITNDKDDEIGSMVYAAGHSNLNPDDDNIERSFDVKNTPDEILKMIRHATA